MILDRAHSINEINDGGVNKQFLYEDRPRRDQIFGNLARVLWILRTLWILWILRTLWIL
jgi:hypothetical protein